LAARVVGEVTEARLATVRAATAMVEEELRGTDAFQYLAVLLEDRATVFAMGSASSPDYRGAMRGHVDGRQAPRGSCRGTCCSASPNASPASRREPLSYDLTPKPPATVEYI
jgi:GMP synthase PP-ATPase subunit